MRPSLRVFFAVALVAVGSSARAQTGVGIGTTSPDAKAALDISATDKGLLIPRMTAAQRTAIAAPPTGLMIFQTDGTTGFWYYFGGAWVNIPNANTAGDNLGNHTATQNLELAANTLTGTGQSISAVGLGVRADGGLNLGQNTAGNNLLVGYQAGQGLTPTASTGLFNQFVGYQAGQATTSGRFNLFNGAQSGYYNTTGSNNQFSGYRSGYNTTTGNDNIFSGFQGGYRNTSGSYNVFSGYNSGFANTTGSNNVAVGLLSGFSNITGTNNTSIGAFAGPITSSLTNATALGANAQVSQSNSLVLGGNGANAVNVGIGTAAPAATLHVAGSSSSVRLEGLVGTGTRMVTTDASGNLSTQNVPVDTDTDAQQLSISGSTISLTNGGSVTVPDASATNELQTISKSGSTVTLSNGGGSFTDTDTDAQALSISGSTITISGSNSSVTVPSSADNLGNHTATQNLSLGTNQLVGNGGTSGVSISSAGYVGIGTTTPTAPLHVAGSVSDKTSLVTTANISASTANSLATRTGDGDLDTYWLSSNSMPQWLMTDLGTATVARFYRLYFGLIDASNPKTWQLQGSNDGSTWATVHTVSAQANTIGWHAYYPTNTTAYRYYRLYITAAQSGSRVGFEEFELGAETATSVAVGVRVPQGTVQVGSLAGSTTQMVTADTNGNLGSSALPALSLSGTTLTISGSGSSVTVPGDDLGTHTATQNLSLGTYQLVGNGGSTGLSISSAGALTAGNLAGTGTRVVTADASGNLSTVTTASLADNLGNHTATQNLDLGTYKLLGNGSTLGVSIGSNGRIHTEGQNFMAGYFAGSSLVSASGNVLVGYAAGTSSNANNNTVIGSQAGYELTTGISNSMLGYSSGLHTSTGYSNTFVGYATGLANQTGYSNVAIGSFAGPTTGSTALSNTIAIGTNARVSQSNSMVLGDGTINVGIGTSAPGATFEVSGSTSTVKFGGLAGTGTRVVTADASGNLSTTTTASLADNLGNHTATQNLSLGTYKLVGSGGTTGLSISSTGALAAGNLAGTGTRVVTADASGNLSTVTTASLADNLGNHTATQNLNLGTNSLTGTSAVNLAANVSLNDKEVYFRGTDGGDTNHGLGYYGSSKTWNGLALDGPALYGYGGGILGITTNGTKSAVLRWTSGGRVGIGTTSPTATLDVDGTSKLGTNGTVLSAIIRETVSINIPTIYSDDSYIATVSIPNAAVGATVHVSPGGNLPGSLAISYARVTSAGTVAVKFINAGVNGWNPGTMSFYFTVIQ